MTDVRKYQIHERAIKLLGNSINCLALFIMGKAKDLSQYIAWLRHKYTNYDKYLRIMYDESGNQTELRKYVNRLLYEVMMDRADAKKTLAQIKHLIKQAGYIPPPQPNEKTLGKLALKRAKRREKEERLRNNQAIRAWFKGIENRNRQIEAQEDLIHRQYIQICLHKIGMSNYDLRKKMLPKK